MECDLRKKKRSINEGVVDIDAQQTRTNDYFVT